MIRSLPVTVTALQVPDGFVPPNDMPTLLTTIPQYMDIELEDSGPTIAIDDSPPADTGGLWIVMRPAPDPPEAMVHRDTGWREVFTGQPDQVEIFVGDPSASFDSNGLGLTAQDWPNWALCNGNNGTIDLRNKFVVPGYTYYNGAWFTNIGSLLDLYGGMTGGSNYIGTSPVDLNTGGFTQFQINLWNLPTLHVLVGFNDGYGSSGSSQTAPTGPGTGNMGEVTIPFTNQAQMVQAPIKRLPPYIAVGYVQFVGYN